jgi:hypothetical protein
MRKLIVSIVCLFILSFHSYSQEVGYSTTDIGAEFNHYSGGNIYNFQLAFNSKLHHSFLIRAGYNSVNGNYSDKYENEKGGGFVAGMGYRYYVLYRPRGFFIGAKADYWKMSIDWTNALLIGNTETSFFVPAIETGYMLLVNDILFITPTVSVGTRVNLKSAINPLKDGLVVQVGISAGVKF